MIPVLGAEIQLSDGGHDESVCSLRAADVLAERVQIDQTRYLVPVFRTVLLASSGKAVPQTRGRAQLLALAQGVGGVRPVELVTHGVKKCLDGIHLVRLSLVVDARIALRPDDDDLLPPGLVPDVAFFGHQADVPLEILRRCMIFATRAHELLRVTLVEVVDELVFGVERSVALWS